MTARDLRELFLTFFESKGHKQLPSSSLVPDNDPTVLLTTAGMQQFKPYFLGEKNALEDLGVKRTTTVQKSFRTSDIEEIGDDTHLTFFEMLGNFSFGDYFKTEAIDWAWEFLTKNLHLPADRLWVTIFAGDDRCAKDTESEELWKKYVPASRIIPLSAKTNFWGPPGATGPCGPCTEIFWQTNEHSLGDPGTAEQDYVEIWNLVFMEYFQDDQKKLSPLPAKNVDTGMGLDRVLTVLNQQSSPYQTDLFTGIIKLLKKSDSFGQTGVPADDERRIRIAADHIRSAVFLLSDGVTFSNKDQGYILRRIVRRAADQFLTAEIDFSHIAENIGHDYGSTYPELIKHQPDTIRQLSEEIGQYQKILQTDVAAMVEKMRQRTTNASNAVEPQFGPSHKKLSADEVFTLYSTHGISIDRLKREGFVFDESAVQAKIAEHQALSRAGVDKKFGGHGLHGDLDTSGYSSEQIAMMTRLHSATHLLQAALRQVLGPTVKQSGSDINPERLRFDFSFPRKLTDVEKTSVEALVNEKIIADLPVSCTTESYDQAIGEGALAFFRQKYPTEVKVYTMGDFSKELCGGPHVDHTAEIGHFSITAEQSVGSGTRRIKAIVQ